MKKIVFLFICVTLSSYSQDQIILIDNNEAIESKVIEITETTIKYKKWENLEGPLYNIKISLVSQINYENGNVDQFDKKLNQVNSEPQILAEAQPKIAKEYPNLSLTDVPYYFNDEEKVLVPLESAISSTERIREGFWGHITVKKISGNNSNVRFSKREELTFVIQLNDERDNPYSICELWKCDIKGNRQATIFKEGAGGKTNENSLEIDFEKLNDSGLYKISSTNKLSQGEYFFNIIDDNEVFAFGID